MLLIRHCGCKDFPQIFELLKQLWPDKKLNKRKLHETYKRGLGSSLQCYICKIIDNKIVGFCSLSIKNNLWQEGYLGHIDELVVDMEYRKMGVGSELLNKIIKIAKTKKCKRVELDTAFHRKEAHKFYEKNGFQNRAYLFSKTLIK